MRPTTGDQNVTYKTKAVVLTNIAHVLKSDLTDTTSMINQFHDSGKQLGSAVIGVDDLTTKANPVLYIAAGSAPADAWNPASGSGGTPPGNATPTTPGLVKQSATQANSTATDAPGMVTDFNALLAKLKAAGIMA